MSFSLQVCIYNDLCLLWMHWPHVLKIMSEVVEFLCYMTYLNKRWSLRTSCYSARRLSKGGFLAAGGSQNCASRPLWRCRHLPGTIKVPVLAPPTGQGVLDPGASLAFVRRSFTVYFHFIGSF